MLVSRAPNKTAQLSTRATLGPAQTPTPDDPLQPTSPQRCPPAGSTFRTTSGPRRTPQSPTFKLGGPPEQPLLPGGCPYTATFHQGAPETGPPYLQLGLQSGHLSPRWARSQATPSPRWARTRPPRAQGGSSPGHLDSWVDPNPGHLRNWVDHLDSWVDPDTWPPQKLGGPGPRPPQRRVVTDTRPPRS